MSDPLVDTVFRPTTASPALASAAPVRVTGTRTRAGNAMSRTRTALMAGAARAVETSGTKIAMAQVAVSAGVAKATLYNHFRTREAVLNALVVDQVDTLVRAQAGKPLDAALTDAALAISSNPVRAALARLEPAALASLARIDDAAAGWRCARVGVDIALEQAGLGGSTTVLRWLASFLVSPADASAVTADVAVLLAGLPGRRSGESAADADARPAVRPRPTPRSA
ncbi:TetR/AcrR family transcriptional regulator [Jatrophihabitans endophyticus]|uniref:TetR/AcrR family transcriptional regulator n=1 Tax=Jatrophihabitans endophyticus TaxID=1206085 RepID=UPI0019FE801C|nr:TetR/AcrR family transcriptional regulator [Jatrophihabitans endophyticus]MBE7187141.1 TetR family transcriptional regulator [Jatrophihabitans endophyticus]